MNRNFLLLVACMLFISIKSYSQDSTKQFPISFSGYADAYYALYTDSVGEGNFQQFPSVSPRSNSIGLNVAMITAKYSADRVRSTITLHYGDIPKSAWSPDFNFIQEANAGIRLCKNFWVDGGFFRTHVGTEGLFPKENITSSVSVATYFEPYYEAGFKFSFNPNDKLALSLYLLNGYNLYIDNNRKKSVGLMLTYLVNDHLSFGYDNYLGDDTPLGYTVDHIRFYNNVFVNFEKNKFKAVAGIDFGLQTNSVSTGGMALMLSGVANIRYSICNKFNVYGRAELYHDPDGFLSGEYYDDEGNLTGLKLWGATLGVEYKPISNAYIRIEGRDLIANSSQNIFLWNDERKNSRLEAMINLGVWFP